MDKNLPTVKMFLEWHFFKQIVIEDSVIKTNKSGYQIGEGGGGGRGALCVLFKGYVPLAPPNPYPVS